MYGNRVKFHLFASINAFKNKTNAHAPLVNKHYRQPSLEYNKHTYNKTHPLACTRQTLREHIIAYIGEESKTL